MTMPPDPYILKVVETATKTAIELIHEDVKSGLSELLRIVKERGAEQAIKNVDDFNKALEEDMTQRISIGLSPDFNERIIGNVNDPDFAYLIRQATVASARTENQDKHKLLARAVIERLFAKPESLVALASSLACEIIPNLTPNQLTFLGLATTVQTIRPVLTPEGVEKLAQEDQQTLYIAWLTVQLDYFRPFPMMRAVDYDHLQGMSCLSMFEITSRPWEIMLSPRNLPLFTWPEGFLDNEERIKELRLLEGLTSCKLTTVGQVIGSQVHDLRTNKKPTIIKWDEENQ